MVKPGSPSNQQHHLDSDALNSSSPSNSNSSTSCKFKGVRKRKWGKYVSEIRLPNSRERIWLGSYDTAEKAARAFDAALYCLRGRSAKFNFPDNPPDIFNGRSLTPAEIQVEAARFANNYSDHGRVENLEPEHSSSLSSSELHVDSPSLSISDGNIQLDGELPEIRPDNAFLDSFAEMGHHSTNNNNMADYGIFPGFDDISAGLYDPQMSSADFGDENCDYFSSDSTSFLWNF